MTKMCWTQGKTPCNDEYS